MKLQKIFAMVLVLAMVFSGVCFAEGTLSTDQEDYLNKVGAPSSINSDSQTQLGTEVNNLTDGNFRSNLYAAGRYGDNTTVILQSSSTPVSASNIAKAIIQKRVGNGVDNDGAGTELPDGVAGQLLTIQVILLETNGTWIVTPTTKTGFTNITFDAVYEFATLLYVDDTIGWILQGTNATVA